MSELNATPSRIANPLLARDSWPQTGPIYAVEADDWAVLRSESAWMRWDGSERFNPPALQSMFPVWY